MIILEIDIEMNLDTEETITRINCPMLKRIVSFEECLESCPYYMQWFLEEDKKEHIFCGYGEENDGTGG